MNIINIINCVDHTYLKQDATWKDIKQICDDGIEYHSSGATFEDIKLFKEHIGPNIKIKAAGGISSIEDAETFINLGADRLGTSRIIKLIKK